MSKIQVHVHPGGHGRLDGVEKLAELHRAMTAMQVPQDPSGLGVQGREQRICAMAEIIVAAPLRFDRAHGQHRLDREGG